MEIKEGWNVIFPAFLFDRKFRRNFLSIKGVKIPFAPDIFSITNYKEELT